MEILPIRNKLSRFFYDNELCDIRINTFPLEIKNKFPQGIWRDEPDEIVFYNKKYNQMMAIERNPNTGALIGYVGIPHTKEFFKPLWQEDGEKTIFSRKVTLDTNVYFHCPHEDMQINTYLSIDCGCEKDYNNSTYDFSPGRDSLVLLNSGLYEYRDINYLAYIIKHLSFDVWATLEVFNFNLIK